jgi:hypothetical protein
MGCQEILRGKGGILRGGFDMIVVEPTGRDRKQSGAVPISQMELSNF